MTGESDILRTGAEALDAMRRKDPALSVELYLASGSSRGLELREGRLENIHESQSLGTGLRISDGSRMAFGSRAGFDPAGTLELFDRVRAQLPYLVADPHRKFPGREEVPASDAGLQATLWDDTLFKRPLRDLVPPLQEMESQALSADRRVKRVLRSGYGESGGEVAILGSNGIRVWARGTHVSVGLSVLAGSNGETQVGSGSRSARHLQELDFSQAAREASWRATALLVSRKLPARRRSVLFDPWVAGEFLDLMASAMGADQVQHGKSLLRGKLGQAVASPAVSLVDDPRRARGVSSSLFDDEGVPTQTKAMVDRGVLRELFYDTYTGSKDSRKSNGSAGRPSFRGTPSPGPSNFYLAPGEISRDSLIRDTPEGILVFEVMGMHTADPISGDFSVGISGVAVEGGELTHGVRGSMLSGNLLELFGRVDAAASDLTFYGSVGAPTFRARDLTIA